MEKCRCVGTVTKEVVSRVQKVDANHDPIHTMTYTMFGAPADYKRVTMIVSSSSSSSSSSTFVNPADMMPPLPIA